MFCILEIIYFGSTFYNSLVSLLENESTVSVGLTRRNYRERTPRGPGPGSIRSLAFPVGALRERELWATPLHAGGHPVPLQRARGLQR